MTKKTILITGATGNLGKAVSAKFKQLDYNIFATSSLRKNASSPNDNITLLPADLTSESEGERVVREVVATAGGVDAGLLLVGGFAGGNIAKTDSALLQKMISLNFNTAYHIARPLFAQMKSQSNGGRIILIGSRPSLVPGDGKNAVAYALAKSLLFRLAEILNAEGAAKGVITSVLVPSTIDTPDNRSAMPDSDFSGWVSPDDIASSLAFLCSDEAKALREPVLKMYGNA